MKWYFTFLRYIKRLSASPVQIKNKILQPEKPINKNDSGARLRQKSAYKHNHATRCSEPVLQRDFKKIQNKLSANYNKNDGVVMDKEKIQNCTNLLSLPDEGGTSCPQKIFFPDKQNFFWKQCIALQSATGKIKIVHNLFVIYVSFITAGKNNVTNNLQLFFWKSSVTERQKIKKSEGIFRNVLLKTLVTTSHPLRLSRRIINESY